jgi:3-deoxy-D-manno-octulosonic-acid transferase
MKWSTAPERVMPVANRAPWTLRAYRLLTALALPFANMILDRRLKRGKELAARLPERRGESSIVRPKGPLVWMHAASVGEMLSILPLIDRIRERDATVLVTAGTVTAAELAERRLPPGVIHQFVPLDLPQFVARFLDHWRPNLGLFVESDLWPNLIMAGAERGIPLILVNGRVSERSFQRWRTVPRTIAALLSRFDLCLAQSAEDATRYAGLGAPRYVLTGNLKLDVPAPPADPTKLWQLQAAIGTRPLIAAASTHPGEEIELVDVHRRLKHSFPGLLTILVPRHPERGAAIAGIARGAGLTFAQRSLGELPERDTEIYIADTLGELGLVYRLAPIVFIGGSLVSHGGQNPIEAAKLGAAILHGPHVWNFAEIYSALDAVGGAELVTDSSKLTVRIGAWLTDADARKTVAQTGLQAMDTLAGALERTVAALDPYLVQFRLERPEGQRDDADDTGHASKT